MSKITLNSLSVHKNSNDLKKIFESIGLNYENYSEFLTKFCSGKLKLISHEKTISLENKNFDIDFINSSSVDSFFDDAKSKLLSLLFEKGINLEKIKLINYDDISIEHDRTTMTVSVIFEVEESDEHFNKRISKNLLIKDLLSREDLFIQKAKLLKDDNGNNQIKNKISLLQKEIDALSKKLIS